MKNKKFQKHGLSQSIEYSRHRNMKKRCLNPNSPDYKDYGGRGIKVCERWHIFLNFYEDMGKCPPGYELDRIDVNGDYTPENCRWVDKNTQAINKRTYKNNKTGIKGVYFHKLTGKYAVSFRGKSYKEYETLEEAILVRKKVEEDYYRTNKNK